VFRLGNVISARVGGGAPQRGDLVWIQERRIGYRIHDTGGRRYRRKKETGHNIQDTRIKDTGYWTKENIREAGYSIQETRYRSMVHDIGYRVEDTGYMFGKQKR
jgi:hypothetical protein